MVLNERGGRTHHSYVRGGNVIVKFNDSLMQAKKEPYRKVFQVPNFMVEADTPIQVWKRSGDVAQINFGNPSAADRETLNRNRQGCSLKINIWN